MEIHMRGLQRAGAGLALIVISLAGCGGDDEGSTAGSAATDTSAASPTAEPSEESPSADTGDDEGFCAEVEAAGDELENLGADADFTDVEDAANALRESRDTLQSVDPPAEIAEDWSTVISYFDTAVTGSENLDLSDPAELEQQLDDLTTLLEEGSTELEEAGTRIDAYLKDECGIVLE
jgi:hypothetical protein